MNFKDYYWHDAVIKNIIIDRHTPGYVDEICFRIEWPEKEDGTVDFIFEHVYMARMNLNFGIIAEETIKYALISEGEDEDLTHFYSLWNGLMDTVKLNAYTIQLNSTGGNIKILAEGFRVEKIEEQVEIFSNNEEFNKEDKIKTQLLTLVLSRIPDEGVIWGLKIVDNEMFEHFKFFKILKNLLVDTSFKWGKLDFDLYIPMTKQVKETIISLLERNPNFWEYVYSNVLFAQQEVYYLVENYSTTSILNSIGISEEDVKPYEKYYPGGIRLAPASEM